MTGRPGLELRLCRPLFLMYWHLTHTLSGKAHNVYTVRRVKVLCILNAPEDILGKDWVLYFWKSSEYCTPPNLNSLPIVPGWPFRPKCHFCSPSTWRTWAQLVILWEALSCHHFVLSQQWSDFHEKKRGGDFLKLSMGSNSSVSVGCVSGTSPQMFAEMYLCHCSCLCLWSCWPVTRFGRQIELIQPDCRSRE